MAVHGGAGHGGSFRERAGLLASLLLGLVAIGHFLAEAEEGGGGGLAPRRRAVGSAAAERGQAAPAPGPARPRRRAAVSRRPVRGSEGDAEEAPPPPPPTAAAARISAAAHLAAAPAEPLVAAVADAPFGAPGVATVDFGAPAVAAPLARPRGGAAHRARGAGASSEARANAQASKDAARVNAARMRAAGLTAPERAPRRRGAGTAAASSSSSAAAAAAAAAVPAEGGGAPACSVLYQHGASRTCSAHVNRALARIFPHFSGPYDGRAICLTQGSLRTPEGKMQDHLFTSLPPKVHKPIPLGPVSSKLLSAIPREDPAFPPEKVFETCAIVGSSGILLKFQSGKEIDKHELVLRFNSAPTKGFEESVGSKTTHRLTNTRNFAYREFPEEQVLVHLRNRGSLDTLVNRRLRKAGRERLYGLHPSWHYFMDKTFRFLSTSGFNGILLGLHVCQSVTLFGFHVHPRHGALYHYYNKNDVAANEARDGDEWYLVKSLVESGAVSFSEPCIVECHDGQAACNACLQKSGAALG